MNVKEYTIDKEQTKPEQEKFIQLSWQLGYNKEVHEAPTEYYAATVPGAVQLDIARARNYPDYTYSDNYKMFDWMEDMYYTYRTEFEKPDISGEQRLFFVSKGIDYRFDIFLNKNKIHSQEGMFTHVALDLTDSLQDKNLLEVLIYPIPKREGYPRDRTQASACVKPAVSYGWDWHPRLVPLGIWDETFLEIKNASYLTDVFVEYQLADDFSQARIQLKASASLQDACDYAWSLTDEEGHQVAQLSGNMNNVVQSACELTSPHLWWTHDHGEPYLYQSSFKLIDKSGSVLQEEIQKIGFRSVRLIMNEGAWDEPSKFPKTRSVPPAQLELNGRPIFVKGTNWVNPEIFPGSITAERYKELVEMAIDTNFNILRTWGGSIVNKESFFQICDEAGLLIWQEFPLACNQYPDDADYLATLKQEAVSVIKRIRKHPCLALWSGGNELFNSWSKMTDQSLALRLLNKLCLEYDPSTPFIPTSPLFGMVHGNYLFTWQGNDVLQSMNKSHSTAYNEFGISGVSPVEVLEKIIPHDDLFPPKRGTAWETHHAFGAWDVVDDTWLCQHAMREYFGEAAHLDELVAQSQLLQSEGYKAIYEEARRQKPYCAMALNWCFNEPWPAAANNSLIAYPTIPKPALQAVKYSCRPVCTSIRFDKFEWHEDEYFTAGLWLLNDTFNRVEMNLITIEIAVDGKQKKILKWTPPVSDANTNIQGPTARIKLPKWDTDRFFVFAKVEGQPEYNSEYTLIYRKKNQKKRLTAILNG